MGITFEYKPPAVDARVVLAAAGEQAVEIGGKLLLDASQGLVPVDTGALKTSGQVTATGPHEVAVSYGREDSAGRDGANTADYAVIQEVDATLNHPSGGQAHYLEGAMHASREQIAAAMAAMLRAVL